MRYQNVTFCFSFSSCPIWPSYFLFHTAPKSQYHQVCPTWHMRKPGRPKIKDATNYWGTLLCGTIYFIDINKGIFCKWGNFCIISPNITTKNNNNKNRTPRTGKCIKGGTTESSGLLRHWGWIPDSIIYSVLCFLLVIKGHTCDLPLSFNYTSAISFSVGKEA